MWRFIISFCLMVSVSSVDCREHSHTTTGELTQLQAELDSLTDNNIEKLAVYTQLVKLTRRSAPQQALEYAELAMALHQQHDRPSEKALLLGYVTKIHLERKQLKLAEIYINQGIEAAEQGQDNSALGINLFNQALLYQLSNQLVLAINSYQKLEKIYQQHGDIKQLAAIYNNMGIIYFKLGELDEALNHYQLALPLYQKGDNPAHKANTVMNIGEIFYLLKDYQQAEENYLLGLHSIDKVSVPLSYLEGRQRLGILYRDLGQFYLALDSFNAGIEIAKSYTLDASQISLHFDMIKLAAKMQDVKLLQQALANAEGLLSDNTPSDLLMSMDYFRAFVAAELGNWQQAEQSIDRLLINELYKPRYFILQDALQLSFKIKSELGKAAEANAIILQSFQHYKKHQKQNLDSQLSQYAQLYKIKQKENQLTLLKQQTVLQENHRLKQQQASRLMMFMFILICLVLTMLVVIYWLRARNLRRENALSNALMEEKKQFFSDISHELRTPLTVFKLKMEELEYNVAEDPKSVYKLLHERIDSFNCLINDISLLALNDKNELGLVKETIDINNFFQSRAAELKILASQHNLALTLDIKVESGQTTAFDAARIQQVLANLFSNACRYTMSPGHLIFKVRVRRGQLCWRITDSAPSLTSQQCDKIFERLYRADKSRSRKLGGCGLGLAICRDLITAHEGEIHAQPSHLGGIEVSAAIPLR